MSKLLIVFISLSLLTNTVAQQAQVLMTENTLGVADLVRDEFIKGNCRNVSNIISIGNPDISIGQFRNGASSINIDEGIILSTGDIGLARGPNNTNDASFSFNSLSEDEDLNELATDVLFDATGIEFDFVPLDDRVIFRYVFASEEYCEFVGTSFNDVFGFFVSGPGINGPFANNAINVATLIGSNTNVSINNVNHLDNPGFFVSNVTNIDAEACNINANLTFQDLIEYDGFTLPLVASIPVVPCETYHIRLVVGDVGDAILDSAVFLEANSFDLGEEVGLRAEVPGSEEPIAFENCQNAQFVFTRNQANSLNNDLVVNFTISPDSEAINGVDFEEIPLTITIPAGESEFILPINIINDGIAEGPENLELVFSYDCDCIDAALSELIINDPVTNLTANLEGLEVCADQLFEITPEIIEGVPPFQFLWQNGGTDEILESSITIPTQYAVTVTDFCGNEGTATADIEIQEVPTATLDGFYDFCESVETGIPIFFEGNPPWSIQYRINGFNQDPIENITTSPFVIETPELGTYNLIAFNDANCEGIIIGSAEVFTTFSVEAEIIIPTCFNTSDGSIELIDVTAVAPYFLEWDIETDNDNFLSNLEEGTYRLTITDANDCTYEKTFELPADSDLFKDCTPIYVPNIFSPNNDGVNDIFSIFVAPFNQVETITFFQVYNRWGALIFEETDFEPDNGFTGWDGDFKGEPVDDGVYVYQIMIEFRDGSTLLVSGDVTLLK